MDRAATSRSAGSTLGWLLAILALAFTGIVGVRNGVVEWPDAHSALQRSVTGGVFLYGLLGLAASIGLILRKRWSYGVAVAWGVVVTYAAGMSVMAYGGSDASVGAAIAGGGAAMLIAIAVAWATHVATRRPIG